MILLFLYTERKSASGFGLDPVSTVTGSLLCSAQKSIVLLDYGDNRTYLTCLGLDPVGPIGQSLMGRKVGEEVEITTPGNTIAYTIKSVK